MILHDFFDWSNAGVGGSGLLLTVIAIVQATGAKKAAKEAGARVRQYSAEVDFASLAHMAKELHGFVEAGMLREARLRTTDLRSDLAQAIRQHEGFLDAQYDRLKEKQIDLKLLAEGLNRESGVSSDSEKIRLLEITGAILDLLAGQCGELRCSVERGVQCLSNHKTSRNPSKGLLH